MVDIPDEMDHLSGDRYDADRDADEDENMDDRDTQYRTDQRVEQEDGYDTLDETTTWANFTAKVRSPASTPVIEQPAGEKTVEQDAASILLSMNQPAVKVSAEEDIAAILLSLGGGS